jgi:hypothetical protein
MGVGSEIRDPEKTYSESRIQGSKRPRIPDPGVKKAPDPGSPIRIRNTAGRCLLRTKIFGLILVYYYVACSAYRQHDSRCLLPAVWNSLHHQISCIRFQFQFVMSIFYLLRRVDRYSIYSKLDELPYMYRHAPTQR